MFAPSAVTFVTSAEIFVVVICQTFVRACQPKQDAVDYRSLLRRREGNFMGGPDAKDLGTLPSAPAIRKSAHLRTRSGARGDREPKFAQSRSQPRMPAARWPQASIDVDSREQMPRRSPEISKDARDHVRRRHWVEAAHGPAHCGGAEAN